jgi:hypothetical protein
VVIAGATPSAYNGTWTCAAGTTGSSLVVTSAINPGAGSGGTVRLETPATWFNGTWTIASFPNSSTIRVTSAITPVNAGVAGTVTNSMAANCIIAGYAYDTSIAASSGGALDLRSSKAGYLYNEAQMKNALQYGVLPGFNGGVTGSADKTSQTYDVANRTYTYVRTFPSAVGNGNVRQLALNSGTTGTAGGIGITFDERQVKEVGFQLVVTWKHSWEPDLS